MTSVICVTELVLVVSTLIANTLKIGSSVHDTDPPAAALYSAFTSLVMLSLMVFT